MKTKGKCILIVDDEPPIKQILRRNITMSGYDVLIADSGEQAVELVRLHKPDLILLDLWLPGEMDGMSVCVQVRQWSRFQSLSFQPDRTKSKKYRLWTKE